MSPHRRPARVLVCLLVLATLECRSGPDPLTEADVLRATERERLHALVEADLPVARRLHADEFQLVNPLGGTVTKDEYLGGIESGQIDYHVWEPEAEIAVRVHGDTAVLRYSSRLEITVGDQAIPLQRYWHTDYYEKRNGQWQVVWSHATLIP